MKRTTSHESSGQRTFPSPESGIGSAPGRFFAPLLFALSSLLAAFLRIIYLLPLRGEVLFEEPLRDSAVYVARAREILSGNFLGSGVSFHSAPHYPYFLAAVMALSGSQGLWWVRVVQALLSALTVGFLAASALRLFGRSAAIATALLAVFYAPFLFYAGELLEITLTLFSLSVATWILARDELRGRDLFVAGLFLGLAALGKPNLILLIPVLLIYLGFLRPPWRPAKWPWLRGLLLLLGLMLVIAPFTLRNRVVGGDWVLISSNGGINLFIGNNPSATGGFFVPTAMETNLEKASSQVAEDYYGYEPKPSEVSRFWVNRAWDFFTKYPLLALKNFLRKAELLLNYYEIPNHYNIYFFKRYLAPVLRWPLVWFPLMLPLAVLGLVFHARQDHRTRMAAGLLAMAAASVVLFFVTSRYRMPAVIWLLPFAGAGVITILRVFQGKHWRALIVSVLILIAASAVLRLPLVSNQDFAEDWITLGVYWAGKKDWKRVIFYCEQALRENMKSAAAWQNLGYAHMELTRSDEDTDIAEEALWRAVSIDPTMAHAYGNLAALYLRVQRPQLAQRCLDRALEIDPGLIDKLRDLRSFIKMDLKNDHERAEASLENAKARTKGDPDNPRRLVDEACIYGLRLEDYDHALEIVDGLSPEVMASDSLLAERVGSLRSRIERIRTYLPLLDQPLRTRSQEVKPTSR